MIYINKITHFAVFYLYINRGNVGFLHFCMTQSQPRPNFVPDDGDDDGL